MKFLVIYSYFLLFLSTLCSATCPSHFICQCTEKTDYLEIKCEETEVTREQLADALRSLNKTYPIELTTLGLAFGSIPSDFFAGLNIRKLDITQGYINLLGKAFSGLEDTLQELRLYLALSNAKVELNHLNQLQHVEISMNTISEFGNDFLPDNILNLTVNNNVIMELGDKVFKNLSSLRALSFDGNRYYGDISRDMLPNPANELCNLSLNHDSIRILPIDFFTNMPKLAVLSLRNNFIGIIDAQVFKPIWTQMTLMDFYGNPLQCDSRIDWMRQLKTNSTIVGTCMSPLDELGVKLEDFINGKSKNTFSNLYL